jgi:dynein heavy chain
MNMVPPSPSRNSQTRQSSAWEGSEAGSLAAWALPGTTQLAESIPEPDPAAVDWLKRLIALPGIDVHEEGEWTEDHEAAVAEFLGGHAARIMTATVEDGELRLSIGLPADTSGRVLVFFRPKADEDKVDSPETPLTLTYDEARAAVQYRSFRGDAMESLLRLMSSMHVPVFLNDNTWPENMKKEFSGQLHKFMASLTETTFEHKGKTILYIPDEDLSHVDAAAHEKDLVQRLESTLIHWTRQIKDVVNRQDDGEHAEDVGPLAEIQFWRSRTINLGGISEQLGRDGVRQIAAVLEVAKSSYLDPFLKLSHLIQEGTTEAVDNLRFLEKLQEPCERLAAAEPQQIPTILPVILNYIRLIWSTSRFYNTPDKLTGLLRKVSSEIITRCCAKISLEQIFGGDVLASIVTLYESIEAGESWRKAYRQTLLAMARAADAQPWNFDESSIFAQIDAFVQRCRDLLEVCDGQIQFARKAAGGSQTALPDFGGARALEVTKSLVDIQATFEKLVGLLRSLDYSVLDVKATRWHDDHNAFKNGMKDLEVMMQNVINTAFDGISTVVAGVELLEAFSSIATREAIKRAVERKTAELHSLFLGEINTVKRDFDANKKNPPMMSREHPRYAGSAMWAKGRLMRIQRQRLKLEGQRLPPTREAEDARAQCAQLESALEEYIRRCYGDWVQTIETGLAKYLENSLMVRAQAMLEGHLDSSLVKRTERADAGGALEQNFDKVLIRLFNEVVYWEKLRYEIPYVAMEITTHKERFRVMRENVMLVVRDYNAILHVLSSEERRLFQERIHFLDKKITPGLGKLKWASRGIGDYIRECRKHCSDVRTLVFDFKASKEQIARACRHISATSLVHIKRKRVYDDIEFQGEQRAHADAVRRTLDQTHQEVKATMLRAFEVFRYDGDDVQAEWIRFVEKVDRMLEEALRTTVKRSLQELSRAINGDARTDVQPLFRVNAVLDTNRVEFKPTIVNLKETVETVSREAISTVAVVPRLSEVLRASLAADGSAAPLEPSGRLTFFEVFSADDDIIKIVGQIIAGMNGIQARMLKYLTTWDRYKHIWDVDKDAFMRRYAKANRSLTAFETDIQRYRELQNEIQSEEGITNSGFIRIDSSPLKQTLTGHCHKWQVKFTDLLNANANTDLSSLYAHMSKIGTAFKKRPLNLDQLADQIGVLHAEQAEVDANEARFEPLQAQYKLLEKFEVSVKEDELAKLAALAAEWATFKQTLVDAERRLEKAKGDFREDLLQSLNEFNAQTSTLRADFLRNGPFSDEVPPERAAELITEFAGNAAGLRTRESQMRPGLDIFAIEPPSNKETAQTEADIELLRQVWEMRREWNDHWNEWKYGKFAAIDVGTMEAYAQVFAKRIYKLQKEVKAWKALDSLKDAVDQFKKTLPLILDLRNDALRDRHWAQLMEEIGKHFDPHSDEFTLERVFSLGLDLYIGAIGTIANAAGKELAIEQAIEKIDRQFAELPLELTEYKGSYLKVKTVEDVYTALEDNAVLLSTMKASRFAASFVVDLDRWERSLSVVSETIELLMAVQRQWMYLESIFGGSEDIRKQLPTESAMFESVNANYVLVMTTMQAAQTALRATHAPGIADKLQDMDAKLQKIQKSLNSYLETKRQAFPRFYFLSNDDLLEILGQARDPMAVQPHVKKCFEAIRTLEMLPPGRDGRKAYEAVAMNSPDGEVVPLSVPVACTGPVEGWLLGVEHAMTSTLEKLLFLCFSEMRKTKKEKWIKEWAGQLALTSGQIEWTAGCTKALNDAEKGNKQALRQMKKKQVSLLGKFSDMVRGSLGKVDRKKVVAIITIEVHGRDVIDRMAKAGCQSVNDFDWLLQLRFYWEGQDNVCVVRQTNTRAAYGYEYLGNNGRLVITPLTDRCYTTLTTALHLRRGGLPQGPAGTGKTETVKDLSKALAKACIVFNCSDGLDYRSLGRMFSGLAQTGAWSCFDEFNRIEVEVLSVVAQQILSILSAITAGKTRFTFEGAEIKLDPTCGIFVTMNPGYAGRSELPENLKALLRPMSMMVPDISLIIEIMLFAEGFTTAKVLAKKMTTLYAMCVQQLSKQDHYDYGLRSVRSVLNSAGALKRVDSDNAEDVILLRAIRDMNVPKFVSQDMPLFNALVSDLFPSTEVPTIDYGALQRAIEAELELAGLQKHPQTIKKAIQTYESKLTRHGNMLVGSTLSGKSTAWQMLVKAMCRLRRENVEGFVAVRTFVINPKAIPYANLYGEYDLQTFEWTDGVLSKVMREQCADERPDQKWLLLDGPVDTLWIESMNTVLDDNKMLTLINGERIAMPPQVSLLFEVMDLSVASPATVSRAGMVYVDALDLGYQPYVDSWLQRRAENKEQQAMLRELCDKCLSKALALKASRCKEPVAVPDLASVVSLAEMFDAVATLENGVDPKDAQSYLRMTELWFLFSLLWTVGITVDELGRVEMDSLFREIDPQIPGKGLVYDCYVDPKKKSWAPWDDKVNHAWRPSFEQPFYKLFVPTVDTVRYSTVISMLVKAKRHTLVTGESGVAKSAIIFSVLSGLDESFAWLNINFSAQTKSVRVSDTIETRLEKRTKDTFAPPGGRRLVAFIDDFNMPEKEAFGAQPPLELLRMWIEYEFWYDLKKQSPKYVKEMQLLAAMGHPGGGRTVISPRVLSCFHVLNVTFPSEATVKRIFGTLINAKLVDFDEEIKPVGEMMTAATYELYLRVCNDLLPTPDKPHYVFNLRDISRVFEGVLQMNRDFYDSKEGVIRLWVHEVLRVFSDRLVNAADRETLHKIVCDRLETRFGTAWGRLFRDDGSCPPFGDFMREMSGDKRPPYEEMSDSLALKKFVEDKLEDYNMESGSSSMDLVLFRDAIEHVCRLRRVISMPRGNAMLVGVGGSGRQSLARLTAFLSDYKLFQVEITRQYKKAEFHEDLRKLYALCGLENKPTIFLFNDTQVIEKSFLEDINSILTSGEVPNLYSPEELGQLREALRPQARAAGVAETNDALWSFFIDQARSNMHIVLAMSPVGETYRNYVRMFPSLVNCTTIDWFDDWPKPALQEVAMKFLESMELGDTGLVADVGAVFASAHYSVIDSSRKMLNGLQRHNYTTPTNYLSLVKGYCDLLKEKRRAIGELRGKLSGGLTKLSDTAVQVSEMSVELEQKKKVVAKAQTECEELLVVIVQEKRQVDEQQKTVTADAEKISLEEVTCKAQADEAQADLDKALPALEQAQKALELLNKKDMSEIKAYQKPPDVVALVLSGVMVLVKCEASWNEAKKQLGDPNFLNRLINYDKDQLVDSLLNKVSKFTTKPEFDPETVGAVSKAAKSLCMWVRAMEVYGRIAKDVAPKRAKVQTAMRQLSEKQELLASAKASLQEITDKVLALKEKYNENVSNKERLKQESEDLEIKLERATALVDGLGGERERWEGSIARYDEQFAALPGDCLVAAAFLSYCGPFPSEYRSVLVKDSWLAQVRQLAIPSSPDFDFCNFLSNPEDVRDWNIQGLPQDAFSTENGVLVTRGTRWPLMIDPQEQANKWVKNMEKANGLKLVTLKQTDFLRTLKNAISFGAPVLMQEVLEELDPSLDPIMSKAIVKTGSRYILRLGDKEVDYNFDFRLYLTTKLGNPHYTPEISTKSTIVNFSVKEQGLEDQLLGAVVRKERPELEVEKNDLVVAVAAGKRKLVELEDLILRMLSQASGSLLDDEDLVLTLQSSKNTSEEVKAQLAVSEKTEIEIDKAREGYRPCAYRASILYFMLNDLARVDPMYQFSLDAYVTLFNISLEKSTKSDELAERLKHLNEYHTYFVYRNTCRGLFEAHKLLFAFQICAKILQGAKKINVDEYNFFLRGGQVFDRTQQPPNPCTDWLSEQAWDNITELDKLYNFRNILSSFSSNARDWKAWYRHTEPETSAARLPGEWENKCTELQRLIIVRCLRPDRIIFAVTSFIVNNLGQRFTEPPVLDLTQVVVDSVPTSPLIFVLSPGVDPTNQLMQLAEQKGVYFSTIALGQGQSPHAIRLIDEGIEGGHWVRAVAGCRARARARDAAARLAPPCVPSTARALPASPSHDAALRSAPPHRSLPCPDPRRCCWPTAT